MSEHRLYSLAVMSLHELIDREQTRIKNNPELEMPIAHARIKRYFDELHELNAKLCEIESRNGE